MKKPKEKDCLCEGESKCLYHREELDQVKDKGITVRELIEILKTMPQDLPVAGGSGDEYMNAITGAGDLFAFKNVVGIQFGGALYTAPIGHATAETVCEIDEE